MIGQRRQRLQRLRYEPQATEHLGPAEAGRDEEAPSPAASTRSTALQPPWSQAAGLQSWGDVSLCGRSLQQTWHTSTLAS